VLEKLTPVLTKRWLSPDAWKLDVYERLDGYAALRKALNVHPDDLIQLVKDSGLRGRGGAGFPTGLKWGFIPQGDGKPHYLVINADEGEPGTCKDLPLMTYDPHSLIEGAIIAAYAIRSSRAFIYIRGEAVHAARRLRSAVREAYAKGYLGEDILGSGFDLDLVVHSGAGAYICGEETALLDSLEGFRGQPRLRPPFPAVAGLYASPTVVNNVGTIASVPYIVLGGADWWKSMGTEKSSGPMIYSLSGRIANPGQYECGMGITLRELIELAGGMKPGHELRFWTPGGSPPRCSPRSTSTPRWTSRAWRRPAPSWAPRRCRSSPTRTARCTRPGGGWSFTTTSRAASAPRAARATTGWCARTAGSSPDRAPTRTWTPCRIRRTTSSGGRSAGSATARPPRWSPRCSGSGRTTWTTSRAGPPRGCPRRPW
jgi:NADH:ubiquinone oxidoreductase subunit F (NADH-binding)